MRLGISQSPEGRRCFQRMTVRENLELGAYLRRDANVTVVAGMRAAANFARLFAEADRAEIYEATADSIVAAMREHLYSPSHGRFLRSLQFEGDEHYHEDATVDASLFAAFYFGCFEPDDEVIVGTMRAVEEKLTVGSGGIARFNMSAMRSSAGI